MDDVSDQAHGVRKPRKGKQIVCLKKVAFRDAKAKKIASVYQAVVYQDETRKCGWLN
jgi:hypothetical protein